MAIEFIASETHYLDHLIPIYKALPTEMQGNFHIQSHFFCAKAAKLGIPKEKIRYFENGKEALLLNPTDDVMTSAIKDARAAKQCNFPGKRIFLCEHGCGQTFNVGNGSYAGGLDRGFISLFLVPGEIPYKKQVANYPNIPCVKTGCPKLDFLATYKKPDKILQLHEMTVGVSFHFACGVCPETGTSWNFFWKNVVEMIEKNPRTKFIGHAHPRMLNGDVALYWEQLRTRCPNLVLTDDFNHILIKADLYICDQSSTIFEFVSLDKPVILMNSPKFRRNVNHGMRFWELSDVGVNVEYGESLHDALREAVLEEFKDTYSERRKRYTEIVYSVPRGEAAKATAQALVDFVEGKLDKEPIKMADQPIIKMKALKMLVQDEGTLFPGLVFQPGYLHRLEKVDGKTTAIPTKKLEYIDPYTRASAMNFHKQAEYVYEQAVIPPEELEPFMPEDTSEEVTRPEPARGALDPREGGTFESFVPLIQEHLDELVG